MNIRIQKSQLAPASEIAVTGSKSESNRLLILQALYPEIKITNISDSDDTRLLKKALASKEELVDIEHAGTAMRFLTAYFASRENCEKILTGSQRMRQRPIGLLVDALSFLGADITYLENEGFPPLRIKGKRFVQNKVRLKANVSSQYISALMLIAPSLPEGLEINLEGMVTSEPYIRMTISLLKKAGLNATFKENCIKIPAGSANQNELTVESDWSSASYFYSIAALAEEPCEIRLSSYRPDSIQGDREVARIYEQFGIKTTFSENSIMLSRLPVKKPKSVVLDLKDSPDLAQTIAVTCFGLNIKCELSGLHTLKIKETDRLSALKNEIGKLGGRAEISRDSIRILPGDQLIPDVKIETYHDHRMALAFAPLALMTPIEIMDAGVISKSYPAFWKDLGKLGFKLEET